MKVEVLFFLFLCFNSVCDLKKRIISLFSVLIIFVLWFFLFRNGIKMAFLQGIIGLLPGIVLGILSFASKGKIGMGDVFIILLMGWYFGLDLTICVLMGAFMLAAMFGMVLLCLKRAKKNTCLPFLPFLTASFLFMWLGEVG